MVSPPAIHNQQKPVGSERRGEGDPAGTGRDHPRAGDGGEGQAAVRAARRGLPVVRGDPPGDRQRPSADGGGQRRLALRPGLCRGRRGGRAGRLRQPALAGFLGLAARFRGGARGGIGAFLGVTALAFAFQALDRFGQVSRLAGGGLRTLGSLVLGLLGAGPMVAGLGEFGLDGRLRLARRAFRSFQGGAFALGLGKGAVRLGAGRAQPGRLHLQPPRQAPQHQPAAQRLLRGGRHREHRLGRPQRQPQHHRQERPQRLDPRAERRGGGLAGLARRGDALARRLDLGCRQAGPRGEFDAPAGEADFLLGAPGGFRRGGVGGLAALASDALRLAEVAGGLGEGGREEGQVQCQGRGNRAPRRLRRAAE